MLLLVALFGCHDSGAVDTASDTCYTLCYNIRETCSTDSWAAAFYGCIGADKECWSRDPFPDCVADCDDAPRKDNWEECYADAGFEAGMDIDDCYDIIQTCGGGACHAGTEYADPECPATGY